MELYSKKCIKIKEPVKKMYVLIRKKIKLTTYFVSFVQSWLKIFFPLNSFIDDLNTQ